MRRPPIRHYYLKAKAQTESTASDLDVQTNGFAGMTLGAVRKFFSRDMREAAALSYYALFSLFPLSLLVIVIIGRILGPAATKNQVEDFLSFFLPGQTATELNQTLNRFVDEGGTISAFAVLGLMWSALGVFSNLESALSRTFRDTQSRPFVQRRIVGVLMILGLGVLLVANIVTSLLFSFLNLIFLNQGNIWLSIGGFFIPFGFSMGIFAMLYRWIPRNQVGWDAIWPAALFGGVAWEAAKRLFGWYLDRLDNLTLVYGSITTVIIFMLWTFYTSCILLLCAEFCVALHDWLEQRRRDEPEHHEFARDYYDQLLYPNKKE